MAPGELAATAAPKAADMSIPSPAHDRLARRESAISALARLPASDILNDHEQAILAIEEARGLSPTPGPARWLVVIVKATRLCNLRCVYCRSWAEGPNQTMTFDVMARSVREALSMPNVHGVEFVWHGGEVTMLKPKVFRKFLWLQERYRQPGQEVKNSIQTNATHLTDEWIDFLHEFGMGVGVSIDGPPELNDRRRLDKDGRGTSSRIAGGIARLRQAGIPHAALVVIDREIIGAGPERLLGYLADIGLDKISFLNVLPENDPDDPEIVKSTYFTFPEYVRFLTDTFSVWWNSFRDRMEIREFRDFIQKMSVPKTSIGCLWMGNCMGRYVTLEANGDLAPCDKYRSDPGSILGNVMHSPMADIIRTSGYLADAKKEASDAKTRMAPCKWFHVCNGGCPHDRHLASRFGDAVEPGRCCGVAPLLDHMARTMGRTMERAGIRAGSSGLDNPAS